MNSELVAAAAPELLTAAFAGIAYVRALKRANDQDPEGVAMFRTAKGEDLDELFEAWKVALEKALEKAGFIEAGQ